MIKNVSALSLAVGMWFGGPARGAVINVDFQASGEVMTGNAGAVIPFAGSYWNASGTGTGTLPLLTSTGESSGLDLKLDLSPGGPIQEGDALYRDYVYGDATVQGLDPGQDYHIVIYSAANLQGIFRVAQPFDTNSPGYGEISCFYEHTLLPGVEGCDYVEGWATADGAGEINVRVHPGAMSGMQVSLVPNPEPSVLLLHLLAGLGAALRRRRI